MTDGRRIFHNFSALMLAQLISNLAGLASTAYLARILLPEGFGVLGWGTAILGYLGLIVNPGIDRHAMREIAQKPHLLKVITGNVVIFRLAAAVLIYGLFAVVVVLGVSRPVVGNVLLMQGCGLFVTAITVEFAFQAKQRMGLIALRQIVASLLALAGMLVFVRTAQDIPTAAGVTVVATGLASVGLIVMFLIRFGGFLLAIDFRLIIELVRKSLPVALAAFLTAIFVSSDIVMLGFFSTEAEVGLYSASARIFVLALLPASMIGSAFLPHLAAVRDDKVARLSAMTLHAKALLIIGAMIVAGGLACTEQLISLLFGPAFTGAIDILPLLLIAVGFAYCRLCYDAPLLAWGSDGTRIRALALGTIANILLNLYLIPDYHGVGAAVATIISEVIVFLALAANRQWYSPGTILSLQGRGVLLTVIAGVTASWLVAGQSNPFIALSVSAVAVLVLVTSGALLSGMATIGTLSRIMRPQG